MKTSQILNYVVTNRAVAQEERLGYARELLPSHKPGVLGEMTKHRIKRLSVLEIIA